MEHQRRKETADGSKVPTCPPQHLALQKVVMRTTILGWTDLLTPSALCMIVCVLESVVVLMRFVW